MIGKNKGVITLELILSLVLVIALFLLAPAPMVSSGSANDTVILDVNVSTSAQIRVLPVAIAWNASDQVDPGSNGSIKNLTIKNAGSINVTNFYATVDTLTKEDTNPLSIGNALYYAAGGVILIRNETDTSYFHLGRIEWNLSENLDGETLDLEAGTTKYSHGWYRTSWGDEYLWKVENGTDGYCNNTNTIMKIKKDPENATTENRDLDDASGNIATGFAGASNANWTFFTFTEGPLSTHCVAAYHDCTKIYIYKFDKGSEFGQCTNSTYLTQENLTPGDKLTGIKLKPSIPEGFPGGDLNTSVLTIFASSA